MRQRLDDRSVHREHGVEEMGEANPQRLGDQAELRAVSVEAPEPPDLHDLEPGFVVTVEQLVGDLADRRLVGQLQCLGAEPLDADDCDEAVSQHAAHRSVGPEVFELHALLLLIRHVHRTGSAPMWLHRVAMPPVLGRRMIAGSGLKAAACMTKRLPPLPPDTRRPNGAVGVRAWSLRTVQDRRQP